MHKFPMTVEGAKRLKDELERLTKFDRSRVIQAIAEARAHGDLRENAEYHEARRQQSFIEGRIQDITAKLNNAHVIDPKKIDSNGKVVFAATVELSNTDTEAEVTYQIVGEDEADLKHGKISVTSPIARALIGKREGDFIEVTTPDGGVEYEIVAVRFD